MLMGTPDSSASRSFWLILMISTSLWVRSSSDLMPDSRVIEGLTETGGTGMTWRTAHSGRAALGSIPRRIRSSSGILSSLSRTVLGVNRTAPPSATISWKVVGLPCSIGYCFCPQWGHCWAFLASLMISSRKASGMVLSRCLRSAWRTLNFSIFSSLSSILPQFLQVIERSRWMSFAKLTWITGSASSMWPKWPGQAEAVLPQVLHFWRGSRVPSLPSISPDTIGTPSSS